MVVPEVAILGPTVYVFGAVKHKKWILEVRKYKLRGETFRINY